MHGPGMCKENYHENEALQYYCEECEVCICHKCGQTRHNQHWKVDIQEASEAKRVQRRKVVDRAKADVVFQEAKMTEQTRLMNKSKEEVIATQNKVTETVEELIGRLREHEADMKRQLTKINATQQTEHTTRLAEFQLYVTQLKTSIEHDEVILQKSTGFEMLQADNAACFSLREEDLKTQVISMYRPRHVYYVLNEDALNVSRPLVPGQVCASHTDPSQSMAEGRGLKEAELGSETSFKVITRDSEGNQCYCEQDQVSVQICSPTGEDEDNEMINCKDGSYVVRYKPKCVGLHDVRIAVNGQPLPGSPWSVQMTSHRYRIALSFASLVQGPEEFAFPWSLALNERTGQVAIAGYRSKCIQLFDRQWKYIKTIGGVSFRNTLDIGHPISVAFLRNDDVIFTREGVAHAEQMSVFTVQGQFIKRFSGHVVQPLSVFVKSDDGHVIVSDVGDKKIKVLSPDGRNMLQSFSPPECNETAEFVSYHNCKFFASYLRLHCVKVFNDEGLFLYDIGSFGSGEGQLVRPIGLAVDSFNQLIVCDSGNKRMQVFTLNGTFLHSFTEQAIEDPWFVAVSNSGDILISDVSWNCIHVLK